MSLSFTNSQFKLVNIALGLIPLQGLNNGNDEWPAGPTEGEYARQAEGENSYLLIA